MLVTQHLGGGSRRVENPRPAIAFHRETLYKTNKNPNLSSSLQYVFVFFFFEVPGSKARASHVVGSALPLSYILTPVARI
jgi:hypothetical protein